MSSKSCFWHPPALSLTPQTSRSPEGVSTDLNFCDPVSRRPRTLGFSTMDEVIEQLEFIEIQVAIRQELKKMGVLDVRAEATRQPTATYCRWNLANHREANVQAGRPSAANVFCKLPDHPPIHDASKLPVQGAGPHETFSSPHYTPNPLTDFDVQ